MQKLFNSFAKQPSHHNSSSQTTRPNWHGPCFEVVQVVESLERCVICLGHKARQKSCQRGFVIFGALRPRQRPRLRPSQLYIPLSKTMNPYRHHDVESGIAQHTASRMQIQCESHSSSQSHEKHDSPSRDRQSTFERLL